MIWEFWDSLLPVIPILASTKTLTCNLKSIISIRIKCTMAQGTLRWHWTVNLVHNSCFGVQSFIMEEDQRPCSLWGRWRKNHYKVISQMQRNTISRRISTCSSLVSTQSTEVHEPYASSLQINSIYLQLIGLQIKLWVLRLAKLSVSCNPTQLLALLQEQLKPKAGIYISLEPQARLKLQALPRPSRNKSVSS